MARLSGLVVNSGSSSIKFAVYPDDLAEKPLLKGQAERIGLEGSSFRAVDQAGREVASEHRPLPDHQSALKTLLECVRRAVPTALSAVGHRVVRGGIDDRLPRMVTQDL